MEVKALKEPVDCLYAEHEATGECGGGLPRPSAKIRFNRGSALIVTGFLVLPAMIWLRIVGRLALGPVEAWYRSSIFPNSTHITYPDQLAKPEPSSLRANGGGLK